MEVKTDIIEKDFSFEFPVDLIEKSGESDKWLIKGVASVEVPDLDEEIIIIKGMDTSYLEQSGLINWNHQKGANALIGEITKSEKFTSKKPAELYVEGQLYKDQPEARNVYNLMKAIQKSGSSRKMKMSVEGKALLRDGKKIIKSKMFNVALTMQPINPFSYAILSKGMCKHPESNICIMCSAECISKALETGYDISNQAGAAALRAQSLEGACSCKKGNGCSGNCKKVKKGLTITECEKVVTQRFGCSNETAQRVLKILQIQ